MSALDLFAGVGWSVAAERLGIEDSGIDNDPAVLDSRAAAGFKTVAYDVLAGNALELATQGAYDGLIASPPCQTFSKAGKGTGRYALDLVLNALDSGHYLYADDLDDLAYSAGDPRTALVLVPLHYWQRMQPRWVAWEQVPSVLPVWEAAAVKMRAKGYSVWTGYLNAEQYGVPQTRKRAFLLAHRDREVKPPTPTHSQYHSRDPKRLDPNVERWVSMAEALGWGMTERPYPTIASSRTTGGLDKEKVGGSKARRIIYDERDAGRWEYVGSRQARATRRTLDQPAPTLAFGHASGDAHWRERVAAEVEPRMNNQSGTKFDLAWPLDRPAPVIAGRDLVTMPGANANRFNGSTKSRNDGIRIDAAEGALLQSFAADFPFQGNKSQVFRQIGNAVPPLLAEAVLREVSR